MDATDVYFGRSGKMIEISPPLMLQAYAVAGYKSLFRSHLISFWVHSSPFAEGQLLSSENQKDFMFASWKKEPEPLNISKFDDVRHIFRTIVLIRLTVFHYQNEVFHLYSDHAGKIILEHQT